MRVPPAEPQSTVPRRAYLYAYLLVACLSHAAARAQPCVTLANEVSSFTLCERGGRLQLTAIAVGERQLSSRGVDLFAWGPTDTTVATLGRVTAVAATAYVPAHQALEVVTEAGPARLRRVFELYPGAAALRCVHYFSGRWAGSGTPGAGSEATGVEADFVAAERPRRTFAFALPDPHWRIRVTAFSDATDLNNDLVHERSFLPFTREARREGNVLVATAAFAKTSLWLLKESPLGEAQVDYRGYDFTYDTKGVGVVGFGVSPETLDPDTWTRGYSWAVGLASDEPLDLTTQMLRYRHAVYDYRPQRDGMILMNTWGDRGRDGRVGEAAILAELDIAHALGVTHFQIDDGWQAGTSKNSVDASGARWETWTAADWTPHPTRFPRGLAPVTERARVLGMEVGLWFNLTRTDDYRHWERDANTLIGLYRDHGIRTFKIDGLHLPSHRADANLRRFFAAVQAGTGGEVIFNLDATAGRRGGYFHFGEYANVFVENRYTDWGNYYPHLTLRNLWQLAHYVPANKLQVEVLNPARNPGAYPAGDPLAPQRYTFDYVAAVAAVAQPLVWLEGRNLSPEQRELPTLHQLKATYPALHTALALPVGDVPDGTSWTGFEAVGEGGSGFLVVYRELNPEASHVFETTLEAGREYAFELVAGAGEVVPGVGERGRLTVRLPAPLSFGLWRYTRRG